MDALADLRGRLIGRRIVAVWPAADGAADGPSAAIAGLTLEDGAYMALRPAPEGGVAVEVWAPRLEWRRAAR